jgi:beta-RFAP synthase
VIDAGHRVDDADPDSIDAEEAPPVIFQHPLPDDWHFVLATPCAAPGLSGTAEQQAFRELPPMAAERVGRICRLALTQVAPAVLTRDIRTFGAAVTEIQAIVGEYFAPYQGGRFATHAGCEVTEHALAWGARGVGQSSWGPTVFALTEGEKAAVALADSIQTTFGCRLARVEVSRARNRGASCDVLP